VQAERRSGAGCYGVFVGIIAVVLTVISVSVALVLSSNYIVQLTQLVLSLSASLTCLVKAVQLCRLRGPRRPAANHQHGSLLLDLLLVSSVTGVVAMASLDAVAAHDAGHQTTLAHPQSTLDLTLVVSVVVIAQSVLQTGTVAVGLRRQHRPVWSCSWRQSLALLVACNASQSLCDVVRCAGLTSSDDALWVVLHSELPYRSVMHVCAPVAVFHRFVTVICLLVMCKQSDFQSSTATQL